MASRSSSVPVRECRRKDRRGHLSVRESAVVRILPVPGHRELVRGSDLAQALPRHLLPDNGPLAVRRGRDSAMFLEA